MNNMYLFKNVYMHANSKQKSRAILPLELVKILLNSGGLQVNISSPALVVLAGSLLRGGCST